MRLEELFPLLLGLLSSIVVVSYSFNKSIIESNSRCNSLLSIKPNSSNILKLGLVGFS